MDTPNLSARTIANRLNAQKSTGPKTDKGKKRSSQNAIKHGLTAEAHVNTVFDQPGEFDQFQAGLLDHFNPQTAYQSALVDRIITLMWRLRRVPIIEAQIMRGKTQGWSKPHPSMAYIAGGGALEFLHISRYEANLDRCLHRTLKDLEAARPSQPTTHNSQPTRESALTVPLWPSASAYPSKSPIPSRESQDDETNPIPPEEHMKNGQDIRVHE